MREIIEQSKKGQQISTQDLGQSIKAINSSQNIMMNAEDESVDDLLKKLAKKGKKVKLLDEAASVKELPKQEDNPDDIDEEPDLERIDPATDQVNDSIDEINEEAAPSSVKKKFKKIKDERETINEDKIQEVD